MIKDNYANQLSSVISKDSDSVSPLKTLITVDGDGFVNVYLSSPVLKKFIGRVVVAVSPELVHDFIEDSPYLDSTFPVNVPWQYEGTSVKANLHQQIMFISPGIMPEVTASFLDEIEKDEMLAGFLTNH